MRHVLLLSTVGLACPSWAQPVAEPLPKIVVTPTRSAQPALQLGASVDRVDAATLVTAGPGINASEALARVPGITVLNRQNFAQDLQIQSRGFGARASFGVRGVRLFADGIPLTMPDGQGQSGSFALDSAERIEVLRGPFSALYGNSSGGVIQSFTEDAAPGRHAGASLALGSDGFWKAGARLTAAEGPWNLVADLSKFETDGWREHSAAQRLAFNGKLTWRPSDDLSATMLLNHLDMPGVQDPLGLTRAQVAQDPRQADAAATLYDTRKDIANSQLGGVIEKSLGAHRLRAMAYVGTREVMQVQAIPPSAQAAPRSAGGVIDFSREFGGADLRYAWAGELLGRSAELTAGLAADEMREDRRGFNNFTGSPAAPTALGVQGALRRDETNTVRSLDQYVQGSWRFAERWNLSAGARHSRVSFETDDHYLAPGNGDDSGRTSYDQTSPVASLVFQATPALHLYASAGRSFETPTLNEAAYRPDGSAGLNLALRPSTGRHVELGAKARWAGGSFNAALFDSRTDDEINVFSNSGGRSTFQNAGRTRRQGAEIALDAQLARSLDAYLAFTYLDATYLDAFRTCTGTPCTPTGTANTALVPAGNQLPGVAQRTAFAELKWQASAQLATALEWRGSSGFYVNDLNGERAAGYGVTAWWLSWTHNLGGIDLQPLLRIDNLFDRRYVGSAIINEANRRYYEPAPGRTWLVQVRVMTAF